MANRPLKSALPLFAPMKSFADVAGNKDETDSGWIMCLWRDDAEKEDFCEMPCGNFLNFLYHLKTQHGVSLKEGKDLCMQCGVIFHSKIEGVNHYLEKALLYEDFSLELLSEDSVDSKIDLGPIFKQIKEIRKVVLDNILFPEDMPELEDAEVIEELEVGQEMAESGEKSVDEISKVSFRETLV